MAWVKSVPASAAEREPAVQSLVWGFPSCRPARAGLRAASSGSEELSATSSCWAEMSWIAADDEDVERVVRKATHWDGEALAGNATAVGSTWTAEDAATAAGRTDFCADHVAREMRQMLGSWIAAYDMTLGGREVEAFGRRPSCRECLYISDGLMSVLCVNAIVCGFVVGCFLVIDSSEAKICRKYASNVPAEVYPLLAPGVL